MSIFSLPDTLQSWRNNPEVTGISHNDQLQAAAEQFEAQFLSAMLQPMFEGTDPSGPFGGGAGETMFRSVMTEAIGKQMVKSGGIGLADTVQREILKLQGLQ